MKDWEFDFFYGGLLRKLWYTDRDGFLDVDLLIYHVNNVYRTSFDLLIFEKISLWLFLKIWLHMIFQEFKMCKLWGSWSRNQFEQTYYLTFEVQEKLIKKYGKRSSIGKTLIWHLEMVHFVGYHHRKEHPIYHETY